MFVFKLLLSLFSCFLTCLREKIAADVANMKKKVVQEDYVVKIE
jgi:hypothetical protein